MQESVGTAECVSFDSESLIVVDSSDQVMGYESKVDVHRGTGKLHRAFSIFLFDGPDSVMLQQRSEEKPLWPGYWTNSCCSHPRRGETYDQATRRRLREELGVEARLSRLYRFQYFARFYDLGAEHELCTVYVGNIDDASKLAPNPKEIRAWDWFDTDSIDELTKRQPDRFTPWFLLEWERLRGDRRGDVEAICGVGPGRRGVNQQVGMMADRRVS